MFNLTHETLPTSKQTLIKEKAIARVYNRIFKEMENNPAFPFDIGTLKTLYKRRIYDQTRLAVQDVYFSGSNYAQQVTGVPVFFSATDEQIISQLTLETVDTFWRRIDIIMDKKLKNIHALEFNPQAETQPEPNSKYIMDVTATEMATKVLAISTIAKIKQITDSSPQIRVAARADVDPATLNFGTWKWIWIATIDAKTCDTLPDGSPGCSSLAGQEWNYEDFDSIRTPGELGDYGTHPNCRCRILLKKDGQVQMY